MAAHLQANGVIFLDHGRFPCLKVEHYANRDHLNEDGRAIWTALMAGALNAIMAGKAAPNRHLPAKTALLSAAEKTVTSQPAAETVPDVCPYSR